MSKSKTPPRAHQIEAVDAAVRGLEGPVRPGGNRGLLVSATGTGKTLIAAETARRLAPTGGTLVLVPTLDLLTQTVTAWRSFGHEEAMLAVCSLEGDDALRAADVRATTSGPSLALWAQQHAHYTVFATYASLGAIIHAHTGPYGTPNLSTWTLVLCDEAHRAAGHVDKSWTDIHDNTLIPALRRLYMTATPRIYDTLKGRRRRRRGERRRGSGRRAGGQESLFEAVADLGTRGVRVGVKGSFEQHDETRDLDEELEFDLTSEFYSEDDYSIPGSHVGEQSGADDTSDDPDAPSGIERFTGRRRQALPEELAISMDGPEHGARVFELGLAESIRRGLLARFQVLVTDIRDKELNQARRDARKALDNSSPNVAKLVEAWRGKRLAALQTALLKTARENGLRTVITFHHRVAEAKAFALGLPDVGRRLRAELPDQAPADVRAEWLHGEHPAEYRRAVLSRFAEPGTPGDLSVVANVRILGEGIDCPAVDGVAIFDEMSSIVNITQALGRALRQKPGQGKVASIIVPVFLDDDERADDMLLSDGHRYLVTVLEALRAHAPELVEALAVPQVQAHGATRTFAEADDEAARGAAASDSGAAEGTSGVVEDAAGPGEPPVPGTGAEAETRPFLRFSSPRDPAVVADFVSLRVIHPDDRDWLRGYLAARRFLRAEGHMRIPLDRRDAQDHDYPVGQWSAVQRREFAAGRLDEERFRMLVMLGMVWSHPDAAFEDGLAMARRYGERVGHLAAPQGAFQDGARVGQWLANLRREGVLDNHPERRAALEELDPWWKPDGWSIAWQRAANEVRLHLERGKTLEELAPGYTVGGEDIGAWAQRHRRAAVRAKLKPGQIEQLDELGVEPDGGDGTAAGDAGPEGAAEVAGTGKGAGASGARARRGKGAWETAFAAAVAYREREGHLDVPRPHIESVTAAGSNEEVQVRLGKWINNQRTRRNSLSEERERLLTELGMRW